LDDGSFERSRYEDVGYKPVNEPLAVVESGTTLGDPDRWQPLILKEALSQNGLPIPAGVQTFIGSNWGDVTLFSISPAAEGPPIDPGLPPLLGDPSTADEYRDVKLAVSVNGALHDAAIAAWGASAHYDFVRPISMIRFLGQNGELPIVPGRSEIITNESSAPGDATRRSLTTLARSRSMRGLAHRRSPRSAPRALIGFALSTGCLINAQPLSPRPSPRTSRATAPSAEQPLKSWPASPVRSISPAAWRLTLWLQAICYTRTAHQRTSSCSGRHTSTPAE
jgi:hypothetical protein